MKLKINSRIRKMQNNSEWLKNRKTGITGTDIVAICGLNPYKSAYDVYLEKTTPIQEKPDNVYMKMGRKLEAVICELYEEESGKTLTECEPRLIRYSKNPICIGSPDRYIETDGVFEAKSTQKKIEILPEMYFVQNTWYVGISQRKYGVVGILERGLNFQSFTNKLDVELFEMLVEKANVFWNENILAKVPPPAQNSEDVLKIYNKHTAGKTLEVTSIAYDSVEKLREVKQKLAIFTEEKTKIEESLKMLMLDAEGLTFGGELLLTWKASKDSLRLNEQKLKDALPEIFSKFTETKPGSRRFLLK